MAEAPKVPRRRRAAGKAEPQATNTQVPPVTVEATPAPEKTQCPFSGVRGFIDWLNVVDDFKLGSHPNYLPRWAFAMLVLLYFAVF